MTLDQIIAAVDQESGKEEVAILICTHAATLIAIGRTLTGCMPEDPNEDEFPAPTAGITKFVREQNATSSHRNDGEGQASEDWKARKGTSRAWSCVMNANCDHLAGGSERAWYVNVASLHVPLVLIFIRYV